MVVMPVTMAVVHMVTVVVGGSWQGNDESRHGNHDTKGDLFHGFGSGGLVANEQHRPCPAPFSTSTAGGRRLTH